MARRKPARLYLNLEKEKINCQILTNILPGSLKACLGKLIGFTCLLVYCSQRERKYETNVFFVPQVNRETRINKNLNRDPDDDILGTSCTCIENRLQ